MWAELLNLVHGISHVFGKGGSIGSAGDLWLHQLSKLCAPTFKGKGGPKESEAWLQWIVKMLESMACPTGHLPAGRRCRPVVEVCAAVEVPRICDGQNQVEGLRSGLL